MSLNALSLLEKAIDEHGSPQIFKERIALAKEEHAALEREVSGLQTKLTGLMSENQGLRSEVADKDKQLERLKGKLHEEETGDRPDVEKQILLFLTQNGSSAIALIATHIGKDEDGTRFHLDELAEAGFIRSGHDQLRQFYYVIDQAGRRYLNQRGLLE